MTPTHDNSLRGKMHELSKTPGFKPTHILFLVTSVFTGILGAFDHSDGMAIIPSMTGVLISAMAVWYIIEGWEQHRFTGSSLPVSIVLYGVAMLDEWGNMMAKGIGGEFGDFYFGPFISSSIVVILILWVILALFNENYSEERSRINMDRSEKRAARMIQNEIVLDRIADKEEKLLKKRLARAGRRTTLLGQHSAIMRRLNSWRVRGKLKKSAEVEVNLLLAQMDIHTDPKKKVTTSSVQWALSSGDGAPSLT